MKSIVLWTLSGCMLVANCSNGGKQKIEKPEKPASQVYVKTFEYPQFSQKAQQTMQQWQAFGNVYKAILNLTTEELVPTKEVSFLDNFFAADSLYRYKWLYINGKSKQLINSYVQKDWQQGEMTSDTVFQFLKTKTDTPAVLFWQEKLLAEVPYSISFRAKSVMVQGFNFQIEREKDHKILLQKSFFLDSLQKNFDFKEVKILPNDWIEVTVPFTPAIEGTYKIAWHLPEHVGKEQYVSLYRIGLYAPEQYRKALTEFSQKNASTKEIKSTYTSIYYWAYGIEEEIKYLWGKNDIPRRINTQGVNSRLRLFESYVRFLKDDVRQNSKLSTQQVKQQVEQIQATFADLILYINTLEEENINEKLENLEANEF